MSAKWHRSRAWDDQHIPPALWPIKALLRAFSSIPLAVVLLSLVAGFAILASVPIGLIALIPTVLVVALTLVAVAAACAVIPLAALRLLLGKFPGGGAGGFVLGAVLAAAGVWLWTAQIWPALRYDPAHGSGLRLFAGFIEANRAVTIRRLPILEMSELEFYSWWPLRLLLLLFVLNMIVATVRRIEFTFPNAGVLTVHSGIVLMAVGSVYYKAWKQEGQTILLAGPPDASGVPTPGPAQDRFYDGTRVSLWIDQGRGLTQRPLVGVPRYNDYGLDAGGASTMRSRLDAAPTAGRPLSIPVRHADSAYLDPDIRFRIVGYASYAEPIEDRRNVEVASLGTIRPGTRLAPVRFLELFFDQVDRPAERPVFRFALQPDSPAGRISQADVLGIEYTRGMPESRWRDLSASFEPGAEHGLVIEVPAAGERRAIAIAPGTSATAAGYELTVKEILPEPPFPIITEGYRGASSSVAIVRVTTPDGESFDRYVYSRFPEISQDMLDQLNERGMPTRRDADPRIRLSYVDASRLQVHLDELADGRVRGVVRVRGGSAREIEPTPPGGVLAIVDRIRIGLGERWEHSEPLTRPGVVPPSEREGDAIGTHRRAMLAVETSIVGGAHDGWSRVEWLPFSPFIESMGTGERAIDLPDGRMLAIAFGRRIHPLPGFALQLIDFEMIQYEHRGASRDYRSTVRVLPSAGSGFEPYTHVAKLNAPLQAPFMWSPDRGWLANAIGRFTSRLNPRQFKFSQHEWDAQGWELSRARADRGEIPRPVVSFTVLGVGNNPGIHLIALGGIMVGVGTPWAFYVKPWLTRRRRDAIKRELATRPPAPPASSVLKEDHA